MSDDANTQRYFAPDKTEITDGGTQALPADVAFKFLVRPDPGNAYRVIVGVFTRTGDTTYQLTGDLRLTQREWKWLSALVEAGAIHTIGLCTAEIEDNGGSHAEGR